MTSATVAAYLRRMQDSPAEADLAGLARELEALPESRERAALLGTIRAVLLRRARRN